MSKGNDLKRAMTLAIKHLRVHEKRYVFNANLWKEFQVEGMEGEAKRYDEIQFAIDTFTEKLKAESVSSADMMFDEEY